MAGYQVQNQNFFVNLFKGDNTEAQIAFLQDTYKTASSVITGTVSASTALLNFYTGARENLPGAYFSLDATTTVTVTLPSAAELLGDASQEILEVLGSSILNVPSTQRAYVGTPAVGSNFQFTIYNKGAGAMTIGASNKTVLGATTGIPATQAGIVTATIVDPTGAATPSVVYTLDA